MLKTKFSNAERDEIDRLERIIFETFNININLHNLFARYITIFKNDFNFYSRLIQKRKPKVILLILGYDSRKALIAAAKKHKVPTAELQHGVIGKLNLGYHYPCEKEKVKYFPDFFLSFGEFWTEDVQYPIDPENVLNYYFPYFNQKIQKFKNSQKNKGQILFISQGTIGETLSEIAFEFAKQKPDSKIIYKLHPGEYDRWETDYPKLVDFNNLDNTEVIDDNTKDLYALFASSEIQVGVYSTAIFEGLALGCKTFVANLPGVEFLQYLIDRNFVYRFKSSQELINNLDTFSPPKFEVDYFFNQSEIKIQDIIKEILAKY